MGVNNLKVQMRLDQRLVSESERREAESELRKAYDHLMGLKASLDTERDAVDLRGLALAARRFAHPDPSVATIRSQVPLSSQMLGRLLFRSSLARDRLACKKSALPRASHRTPPYGRRGGMIHVSRMAPLTEA